MIPLNQSYRVKRTLDFYPKIYKIKEEYDKFCFNSGWNKTGRSYDCAITLSRVDFKNKIVCELGARDSIFSSYVSRDVKEIYVSDTFEGWGDLGTIDDWRKKWESFAYDKNKIIVERQDMQKLTYPDNFFDVVVSFSAIEHIFNGDILAAKEMYRVCKKGGKIVVGTEINSENKTIWHSGSYFYSQRDIFDRIISNIGGNLIGDYDFSYENSDMDEEFSGVKYSSCIFVVEK